MDNNMFAVAVGYHFGFIPASELNGITLKDSGAIRYEGENWNLFKAASYEESRKIDALLDKYGEYRIEDYYIEPVIMCGEMELKIPGFDKEIDCFSFGGYTFVCEDKEIPFDFSGTAWSIEQNGDLLKVEFETGRTPLLTDYFLDDCYEDVYWDIGLRLNDITAAFLAKASAIKEFTVSVEQNRKEYGPEEIAQNGHFALTSLQLSNYDKTYSVAKDVIDSFNLKVKNQVIEQDKNYLDELTRNDSVWITVYKDTLGFPDDLDNLTEICVPTDWLLDILEKDQLKPELWFSEYTADHTEQIALKAMKERKILDCKDEAIASKYALNYAIASKSHSLDEKITAARQDTSGSVKDSSKQKDTDTISRF